MEVQRKQDVFLCLYILLTYLYFLCECASSTSNCTESVNMAAPIEVYYEAEGSGKGGGSGERSGEGSEEGSGEGSGEGIGEESREGSRERTGDRS